MNWTREKLEDAIVTLDTLFKKGEDCIYKGKLYTNTEYDSLRKLLKDLAPDSYIFSKVNASEVRSNFKLVKHYPPMCSLNKINGTQKEKEIALEEWIDECYKEIDGHVEFVKAYKLDGVALRVYYKDGVLVKAGLSPQDGINGEDVTENCRYIEGIPQTLNQKVTCSISGEVICFLSNFKAINEQLLKEGKKLRANARNHAAGAIRQLDPAKTASGKLQFVGYSIENFEGVPPYSTEIERALWANKKLGIRFVRVTPYENLQELQTLEDLVPELDYEVDGAVLSVNNLEDQEQCGKYGNSVTANPRGKIAWKFKEKAVDVIVKGWVTKVGRTGRIVPVLQFDPVELAGTQVRQATGHNIGFMERSRITKGTIVRIIKSGKIIPKVIEVVKDLGDPVFRSTCPCCDKPLTILEGGLVDGLPNRDLVCKNDSCPAKNVSKQCYFLSTIGVKGVGESIVEELVDSALVKSFSDFYKLELKDVVDNTTLTERQALLTLAAIHMVSNPTSTKDNELLLNKIVKAKQNKKKIQATKFIASLGIPGVGLGTANAIVKHFGNMHDIQYASTDEFLEISDVGGVLAENLHYWFDQEGYMLVDDLLNYIELEFPKKGKLSDISFCFSGSFEDGKTKWEQLVSAEGASVKSSVGKSLDYLIIGDSPGSKVAKAEKYGIKIMNLAEFQIFYEKKLEK